MKKFLVILLGIICLFQALPVLAQNSNAGFVPGSIWYSKDPFFEGDKIKIYTVLFNPDSREFSGTVRFFDKDTLLGKKDFIVAPRAIKDISIDWTVTVGNHSIYAKIENAKFLVSPGKYEKATLLDTQTEESKRTVAKKIVPKTNTETKQTSSEPKSSFGSIEKLENLIRDNTPDILAKPIIAIASAIEGFRDSIGESSQTRKEAIKADLATKKDTNPENTKNIQKKGKLDTPFKYLRMFFWSLLSFLFNTTWVFYGLLAGGIFFLTRYIWRLIF